MRKMMILLMLLVLGVSAYSGSLDLKFGLGLNQKGKAVVSNGEQTIEGDKEEIEDIMSLIFNVYFNNSERTTFGLGGELNSKYNEETFIMIPVYLLLKQNIIENDISEISITGKVGLNYVSVEEKEMEKYLKYGLYYGGDLNLKIESFILSIGPEFKDFSLKDDKSKEELKFAFSGIKTSIGINF